MNTTDFVKLRSTIRASLTDMAKEDPQYNRVLELMELAAHYHSGTRKDGVTPEFYHQLSILGVAITQHLNLTSPASVYLAILAHDLVEDFPESKAVLQAQFPEVVTYSVRLSKYRDGVEISKEQYFQEMAHCPVASVAKLIDRLHNLSTMTGVFSNEKMLAYAKEVDDYFLPMAKTARKLFPEQKSFYELAKSMLIDQVRMVNFFVPQLMARTKKLVNEPSPGM
ncbi:hypothetical protein [Pseudomonas sp. S1(2024)]|uniref:hypothetical protein n=1 Tax=Pseudomonas sp. S1(2024) TaxID=3390191 RepID=UPI00397B7A98